MQIKGAPMVFLISGLLSEFKFRPMGEIILISFDVKPSVCLSYVNDIFITRNNEQQVLPYFLSKIDERDRNFKFIMETEVNPSLAFIDV